MIKISNLNKYYEDIKVLSDVNIHIGKGEGGHVQSAKIKKCEIREYEYNK